LVGRLQNLAVVYGPDADGLTGWASVLTIGQAIGPAIGGVLYAGDLVYGAGYALMGLSRWRFWR
jgi:hypothetical protein